MNLFAVSDTHFSHKNIIKYSNRPFANVEEMDEKMIEAWNNIVKPGDVVYHLGDFAFLRWEEINKFVKRLNGQVHLILGNHDKEIRKHQKERGAFATIQDYKEIKVDDTKVILFHYGQRVWNTSHYGAIHLYGHSHGNLPPHGKSVDVGVDAKWITEEYRPIHMDEIMSFMKKQETAIVDHHGETEQEEV